MWVYVYVYFFKKIVVKIRVEKSALSQESIYFYIRVKRFCPKGIEIYIMITGYY